MLQVPTLKTRSMAGVNLSAEGAPLSNQQIDGNWKAIVDFLSKLNTQVNPSLDANGMPKIFFRDIGVANAYKIDPSERVASNLKSASDYPTGYLDGMIYYVKSAYPNTGPCTLSVANGDGTFLPAVPLKIGGADLSAGTISGSGMVFQAVYDALAGVFHFVSSGSGAGGGADGEWLAADIAALFLNEDGTLKDRVLSTGLQTIQTGPYLYAPIEHSLGAIPTYCTVVLSCAIEQYGYALNEETEPIQYAGSEDIYMMASRTASHLTVVQGGTPQVINKNTKNRIHVTPANWRWKVYYGKM